MKKSLIKICFDVNFSFTFRECVNCDGFLMNEMLIHKKKRSAQSQIRFTLMAYYRINGHHRCVQSVRSSIFSNRLFHSFEKEEKPKRKIMMIVSNNGYPYNHTDFTLLEFGLTTTR